MMKTNDDTAVIVCAYNEATVLKDVLQEISQHYDNVVCVDDGSRDGSAEIIAASKATLIRHAINLGAGAALQTGIEYALQNPRTKYFITIDADGQHDIRDAKKMLDYLKKKKLDVVIGSRFLGKVVDMPSAKRVLLKGAKLVSHAASGVEIGDPHNGLQVYDRKFAENLKLTLPDFSHKSEIMQRIAEGGYAYGEFPVTVMYTDYSKSKGQSMLNAVNISFDLFLHKISKR